MERSTKGDFGLVREVLTDVLEPDETLSITPDTRLSEFKVEPVYFLQVLDGLGIHYMRYISGEKLGENHRVLMLNIAHDLPRIKGSHFIKLSELTTAKELIKELTAGDLLDVATYDRRWASTGYDDGWKQAVA